MKKLLLVTLMLSSCACYANVIRGPDKNGYYVVDNCGDVISPTQPKERFIKVRMMPESEATHCESFKSSSPVALY